MPNVCTPNIQGDVGCSHMMERHVAKFTGVESKRPLYYWHHFSCAMMSISCQDGLSPFYCLVKPCEPTLSRETPLVVPFPTPHGHSTYRCILLTLSPSKRPPSPCWAILLFCARCCKQKIPWVMRHWVLKGWAMVSPNVGLVTLRIVTCQTVIY